MSALSAALDEGRRAFSDLRPVERWLITLFLFVTAPVSANLLAKAALHLRVPSKAPVPPEQPLP